MHESPARWSCGTVLGLFSMFSPSAHGAGFEALVFVIPGCRECADIEAVLRQQDTDFRLVDVTSRAGYETLIETYDQYDVDPVDRGSFPCGVANGIFLIGRDELEEGLSGTAEPSSVGAAPSGVGIPLTSPSAFGVCLAGLVDGVNPCSINLLFMLLAYLGVAQIGSPRGRLVWLGVDFIVGTLAAYFLLGIGVLHVARAASAPLKLAAYAAMVTLLLIAKVVGKGHTYANWLRKLLRLRAFTLAMAFVMGFLSSGLEFFCTGQLYLPTLIYLSSLGADWTPRLLYALYLLSFSIPLWLTILLATHSRLNMSRLLTRRQFVVLQEILIWVAIGYFGLQLARLALR